MSIDQMNLVWKLELPPNKFILLMALADIANDEGGNLYPSIERLVWKTGYGKQQVMRLLKALQADRLVIKLRTGVGTGKTNHYQLTLENGVKKSPFERSSNGVKLSLLNESNSDSTESPLGDSNGDSTGSRMVTPGASNGDSAESLNPSFIPPLSEEKNPPSLRSAPAGGSEPPDSLPSAGSRGEAAIASEGDVLAYAAEISAPAEVALDFYDNCLKTGWKTGNGKLRIEDWRAALRQWVRREPQFRGPGGAPAQPKPAPLSPAERQREIDNKRRDDDLADQKEREQIAIDDGLASLSDDELMEIDLLASRRMGKNALPALGPRGYAKALERHRRDIYREKYMPVNDPSKWRSASIPLEDGAS